MQCLALSKVETAPVLLACLTLFGILLPPPKGASGFQLSSVLSAHQVRAAEDGEKEQIFQFVSGLQISAPKP